VRSLCAPKTPARPMRGVVGLGSVTATIVTDGRWQAAVASARYASRSGRSGVIEPSRRSSATSTSSRHDMAVLTSSRRRGKR